MVQSYRVDRRFPSVVFPLPLPPSIATITLPWVSRLSNSAKKHSESCLAKVCMCLCIFHSTHLTHFDLGLSKTLTKKGMSKICKIIPGMALKIAPERKAAKVKLPPLNPINAYMLPPHTNLPTIIAVSNEQ